MAEPCGAYAAMRPSEFRREYNLRIVVSRCLSYAKNLSWAEIYQQIMLSVFGCMWVETHVWSNGKL